MKRCTLTILGPMIAATGEAGIGRMLARALLGLLLLFAILFLSANTLYWPEGWLYVILQSAISGLLIIWLRKHDPALLRERAAFKKPVKGWDAVIRCSIPWIRALQSVQSALNSKSLKTLVVQILSSHERPDEAENLRLDTVYCN